MIQVVNKRLYKGQYLYIGRGSIWGNPFKIGVDGDRVEVIEKYREYLRDEWRKNSKVKFELLNLVNKVRNGEGLVLGCFCKPLKCHGDVLKEVIEILVKI